MRQLVGAVIAVALMGAAADGAFGMSSYRQQLAKYNKVKWEEILWGAESGAADQVGKLDPPYFTRGPARVEVIEFMRHTGNTWLRSRRLTREWEKSLPDGVVVRRMAQGARGSKSWSLAEEWALQQELFCTAQRVEKEDAVHELLAEMTPHFALTKPHFYNLFVKRLGVDANEFARRRVHPETAECVVIASDMNWDRILADEYAGAPKKRLNFAPTFVVNGKWSVSGSWIKDPSEVYRIANRLIREELERGRAHDGPTDNETLTDWMAPRSGEVFRRVRRGRAFGYKSVYSADRREFWDLDANGDVRHVHHLAGEGKWAYFTTKSRHGRRYPHVWRFARQYVSYVGEDGRPQRYGAFQLTDWLSAPGTLWVELPFRGRPAALAFSEDGRVEGRNKQGSVFGTWWLEAGNLNVSFGDQGIESWPWQEAAAHVGFKVPQESLTPWRFVTEQGPEPAREAKARKRPRDWKVEGDGK